jgi:hypothetical protein
MISLTRRDFLQSAFASGLVLATQKIEHARWLLSTRDQIKVGIVGLGSQVQEHLSILAALPIVRIVTLCDPDVGRLQTAASFLRDKGTRRVRLTRRLSGILTDPAVDAISLGSSFPSPFAPLTTLLAAERPILFDSPAELDFEDTLDTTRKIANAGTVVQSRLTDRLPPDSRSLRSDSPVLRAIGVPVEASLIAPPFRNGSVGPYLPAAACIDVLLALSAAPHDSFLPASHAFLAEPRVARSRGSALLEFDQTESWVRRIRVDDAALAPARQASLSLQGQSGRLTLHAATRAHPDTATCTIIDFLTAIRVRPEFPNHGAQRAFLSAGFVQLIRSSNTKKLNRS